MKSGSWTGACTRIKIDDTSTTGQWKAHFNIQVSQASKSSECFIHNRSDLVACQEPTLAKIKNRKMLTHRSRDNFSTYNVLRLPSPVNAAFAMNVIRLLNISLHKNGWNHVGAMRAYRNIQISQPTKPSECVARKRCYWVGIHGSVRVVWSKSNRLLHSFFWHTI